MTQSHQHDTHDLLDFITQSPSPYHAVATVAERLQRAGYRELVETGPWNIAAGDKIYSQRGDGSITALRIPQNVDWATTGIRWIGAHTDSPNFRLKPLALDSNKDGALRIEPYGGVLYHTWLDRDLALAGRVFTKQNDHVTTHLINIDEPVFRIPSLAIHLHRNVNKDGLKLNAQKHLVPVGTLPGDNRDLRLWLSEQLNRQASAAVSSDDILSFDLCLYDHQKPSLGGLDDAFILSARLDNLASCHAALSAMLSAPESDIPCGIAFFDHEEVGSRSAQGAASPLLEAFIQRVIAETSPHENQTELLARLQANSLFVSADMAHAEHPNYKDRHDPAHAPQLGKGPVIKTNSDQAYATSGKTMAFVELCAAAINIKPQHFASRSDLRCGSTIGAITAANLGVATVDIGNPMLSMHSCREMAASADVEPMIRLMREMLTKPFNL